MKTAIISSNLFEWLTPPAVQAGRGKAVRRGIGLRSGSESEVMPGSEAEWRSGPFGISVTHRFP